MNEQEPQSFDENLKIRRWTLGDIPAVQHIAWKTWAATYGSFIPESDMRAFFDIYYTAEQLAEFCSSPHLGGHIAEFEHSPVGYTKMSLNRDENRFLLNSLYVLPGFQGKRIGSGLLQACEEYAHSLNFDSIWLGVMKQNTAALEWYKKRGFLFVEEIPFTMGNTTVLHLIGFRKIIQKAS